MPHAEHTVTVNRPAGAVFDYRADGTHNAEWRSGVLEIERTSPADGKGATYRQVLSGPGGRRIDGDYRVTVFDPPTRMEFQVTAGPPRVRPARHPHDSPRSHRLTCDPSPASPVNTPHPWPGPVSKPRSSAPSCTGDCSTRS